MLAEIITIGDEILIGQIVDTNSAWLGHELNGIGVHVGQITSVPDSAARITDAVNDALSRADMVIVTGGLGPTKDDITKHTLAAMFGMKLVRNEQVYRQVEKMMRVRGVEFNALNRSQAMVPDGCTVLTNNNGTAPGMWFDVGEKVIVSLPGVPFEMKEIMRESVLTGIKNHFQLQSVVHKTAVTFGLAESVLAETISEWENTLPQYLHLAYLPNPKGVRLRLSAYDVDEKSALKEIDRRFAELEKIIPAYVVGYGDTSLESAVGDILRRRGETVTAAESCTGGNIAHRFTLLPGASDYFTGGVISYSNEVKVNMLGVRREDIESVGAVSQAVAEQMADGVRTLTGSTYGIATTGIAGPTGGTAEKPVGTVWIAISTPSGTFARRMVFGALRDQNIQRASSAAINMLRLYLIEASGTKIDNGVL